MAYSLKKKNITRRAIQRMIENEIAKTHSDLTEVVGHIDLNKKTSTGLNGTFGYGKHPRKAT